MLYKYVNGGAQLKSVLNLLPPATYINEGDILLPLHITIPQPDGPAVGIATHDVVTASNCWGCTSLQQGILLLTTNIWVRKV